MDSWSSWQVFSLLCFITLISTTRCHILSHVHARSVNGPGAQSFVDSLFEKYGTNKSMDLKQFEALLKELKVGSMQAAESGHGHHESHHESESESSHGHHDKEEKGSDKCYSAEVLFESFSIGSNRLNQTSFERICPAIVQQIESKSCESGEDSGDESESKAKAWGFGFLSVTIISSASLLGAFIVPFMNKSFYKILLLFMVSLAVGVLSGSGIIHLIPHAFGFHAHDGELGYLWKCLVIIGGIYSFFFLEYVMRMIVRFKEQSPCDNHDKNEMGKSTGDIPAAGIADVQLQLYNVNPDHQSAFHNHSASLPDVKIYRNGSTPNGFPNAKTQASSQNSKKSDEKKKIAPVAWMIIIGDALHNFIDGLAIGASFSSSTYIGVSTSLAIFCEELPHELGDFAVLLNAGLSYKAAMGLNFLSACSCYLGLVIGLLLGYTTSAVTWIYALAGGLFVYIALVDMMEKSHILCFVLLTCVCVIYGQTSSPKATPYTDECKTKNSSCDVATALCYNINGSSKCVCREGYKCADINECETGEHNCDANAICNNTVGSFVCTCKPGYSGNGVSCTDTEECAKGIHNCKGRTVCHNTKGSFVCICREPGYFGVNCTAFMDSSILKRNPSYIHYLGKFLELTVGNNSHWLLCWRASLHGWDVRQFHTRCDGKRDTVTIVKKGKYVFGGYTDIPWESSGGWGYTPNAFIFSISNMEKLAPFVSKVKRAEYAIYRWPYFGPMFGYDVYITNDANSGNFSFAQLGEAYSVPAVVQNRKTILAETPDFSPNEVEVFYLDHTQ